MALSWQCHFLWPLSKLLDLFHGVFVLNFTYTKETVTLYLRCITPVITWALQVNSKKLVSHIVRITFQSGCCAGS